MVLRLIDQHALPIRVLLGAWLKAEISNHKGVHGSLTRYLTSN